MKCMKSSIIINYIHNVVLLYMLIKNVQTCHTLFVETIYRVNNLSPANFLGIRADLQVHANRDINMLAYSGNDIKVLKLSLDN